MLCVGMVIDERYRLDAVLGEGGMGIVFDATHLGLGRRVALKVVRRDRTDGGDASSRLVREARVVSTLKSQHVAQVIDVGTHDGEPYLVMERLEGLTVQQEVARTGTLSIEAAADMLIQACDALDEAHRHGIVHRDVKPSNLFLAGDEAGASVLKVIDFGISKGLPLDTEESHGDTQTGALLGSPAFMSPEQLRSSKDVDARTDIWSLGVVLYFLLTGEKPFTAGSLLDLMTTIVHEKLPSMRALRSDVPAELEAIVGRCLEKEREDRYATAAELAHALAPYASASMKALASSLIAERPASSRRIARDRRAPIAAPASAPAGQADAETLSASVTAPLGLRQPRRPWAALAAATLIVGVAAGLLALRHGSQPVSAGEPLAASASPPRDERVSGPAAAASDTREPALAVSSAPLSPPLLPALASAPASHPAASPATRTRRTATPRPKPTAASPKSLELPTTPD
jgi:serine/threonine-protein kinase